MDRLNEILRQSREQAQQAAKNVSEKAAEQVQKGTAALGPNAQSFLTKKELSKFFTENKLPRYLLYGIILVKLSTIYDKMRQIVAINSVYE